MTRPRRLAAFDAVRHLGAGVLVFARRDRLARDVLVSAMVERLCEREGARIQSAAGSGNGTGPEAALMRNIVAAFSSCERRLIRSRTKAALAVKKARGERVGGVPYGWRDEGGMLVEDAEEQATMARARDLRSQGLSLRAVDRALIEEGRRPRTGGRGMCRWWRGSRHCEACFDEADRDRQHAQRARAALARHDPPLVDCPHDAGAAGA